MNEISDSEDVGADRAADGNDRREVRGIIRQLEEQAKFEKKKPPRKQSEREKEWIARSVDKWGKDFKGMSRDMDLNPMQQSEGDIRRRVERWEQSC